MNNKATEYAVIKNAVDTLGVICAANSNMIIDSLTGILWDEEEAGGIKLSNGKFEINNPYDKQT